MKLKVSIEKISGCNMMTCRNRCGQHFCWECLGPWHPVHNNHFHCPNPGAREANRQLHRQQFNEEFARFNESIKGRQDLLQWFSQCNSQYQSHKSMLQFYKKVKERIVFIFSFHKVWIRFGQ